MEHAALLSDAVGAGSDAVVVAGHSYGGVVALPAAELLGGRVRGVVLVDGIVCDDGEAAHDVRLAKALSRRAEASERGDGMWTPAQPDIRADWVERLEPFPLSAMETPISLSGAVDSLPRTYVLCSRGGMDEQAERARERGWRVVEVESSHALPLQHPRKCAELLLDAASG
jgi:pimeloyl-ACP methyl ester carboxylesterase